MAFIAVVVATHEVSFPPTSSFFECEVFSDSGSYVTQLRLFISNEGFTVAKSDAMAVDWSSDYSLEVPEVALPCAGG